MGTSAWCDAETIFRDGDRGSRGYGCLAVLGPTDSEDAWSAAFLSAIRVYPALPADANIEAWLLTIAHRKSIDVVRAAARRAMPVDQVPDAAPAPSADSRDLELVAALRQLPPRQRQAVAYHYLAGLPHSEVAAIIGGTTDAARRADSDGITALRRTYPRTADHDGIGNGVAGDRTPRTPTSSTAQSSTKGVSR
jgi:RNA polymerase sigma factor (sigma-70 family)